MRETQGVAINIVFDMARRAAREARMEEYRAATMQRETQQAVHREGAAREESLARMRSQTKAQLGGMLAQRGIDPALMMAVGGGEARVGGVNPATASLIARAAARPTTFSGPYGKAKFAL